MMTYDWIGSFNCFFSSILIMNMTISFLLGFIFNRDDFEIEALPLVEVGSLEAIFLSRTTSPNRIILNYLSS